MKRFSYRTMMVREGSSPAAKANCVEDLVPLALAFLREQKADLAGKEYFGVFYLSARNHVIGQEIISVGCLTASLVHPREVFRGAITLPCASIVLFHNHPSGDPEPSHEDIALTRRLVAGGSLLGIEVLDHVVLGDPKFVSLKDRGVM